MFVSSCFVQMLFSPVLGYQSLTYELLVINTDSHKRVVRWN